MPGDGPSLRWGGARLPRGTHQTEPPGAPGWVPGRLDLTKRCRRAPSGEGPSVTRVSRILVCDAHVQRRSAIVTSVSHPRRPSACALLGDTWSPPIWCPRGPWVFPERSPGFCVFLPLEGAAGGAPPCIMQGPLWGGEEVSEPGGGCRRAVVPRGAPGLPRCGAEPRLSAGADSGASGGFSRGVAPGDPRCPRQAGRVSGGGDGVPSWFLDPGSGAL